MASNEDARSPGSLFLGNLDIKLAFQWERNEIIDFLKKVYEEPQSYGVKDDSVRMAIQRVAEFQFETPSKKLGRAKKMIPVKHRLAIAEESTGDPPPTTMLKPLRLTWRGSDIELYSLYDMLAFGLSFQPASPRANFANHWLPLLAMFTSWSFKLGSGNIGPKRTCIIYDKASRSESPQGMLGIEKFENLASVGSSIAGVPLDDRWGEISNRILDERFQMMKEPFSFAPDTPKESSPQRQRASSKEYPQAGTAFGNCAESIAWTLKLKQSREAQQPLEALAGIALDTNKISQVHSYDPQDLMARFVSPCINCEDLVQRTGLELENFSIQHAKDAATEVTAEDKNKGGNGEGQEVVESAGKGKQRAE